MVSVIQRATVPFRYLRRLPRGSDRSVGAGYAMALAATAATTLYFVAQVVGTLALPVSIGDAAVGPFAGVAAVAFLSGVLTVAGIVAPVAFVAGVVAWRVIPATVPYSGALGGVVATILVYLCVGVGSLCVAVVAAVLTGEPVATSLVTAVLVVGFVFVFTCWLTLPVGLLVGVLYERGRTLEESGTHD